MVLERASRSSSRSICSRVLPRVSGTHRYLRAKSPRVGGLGRASRPHRSLPPGPGRSPRRPGESSHRGASRRAAAAPRRRSQPRGGCTKKRPPPRTSPKGRKAYDPSGVARQGRKACPRVSKQVAWCVVAFYARTTDLLTCPVAKLTNQLTAVARPVAAARLRMGKSSAGSSHVTGPRPRPKVITKSTCRQAGRQAGR